MLARLTLCNRRLVTQLLSFSLSLRSPLTLVFLSLGFLLLVKLAASHLVPDLSWPHAHPVVDRLRQCDVKPTIVSGLRPLSRTYKWTCARWCEREKQACAFHYEAEAPRGQGL